MGTFAGISVRAGMTLSFIKAGWNEYALGPIILINMPSVAMGGYMTDSLDEAFERYHIKKDENDKNKNRKGKL